MAKESQCALATDHQVCNDIKWIVILHEWQNSQASDILDTIFPANELGECSVLARFITQFFNFAQEFWVAHGKSCTAFLITRIQYSAIRQDNAHGL